MFIHRGIVITVDNYRYIFLKDLFAPLNHAGVESSSTWRLR